MSDVAYRYVQIERRGPVTGVVLDRPEIHNAFDDVLIRELTDAFTRLAGDAQTRVIVLRGNGKSFCAGADLAWMKSMVDYSPEENRRDSQAAADLFRAVDTSPKPVIARVHGAALGGGVGLVCACDIAIGVPRAKIGFTEARLGILPAVISPYVIRKIGGARARELFVTAEIIDGERAAEVGLFNHVVAVDGLDAAIDARIDAILANGAAAVGLCKELVAGVLDRNHDDAIPFTVDMITRARVSAEGQEGMNAFFAKRRAAYVVEREETP